MLEQTLRSMTKGQIQTILKIPPQEDIKNVRASSVREICVERQYRRSSKGMLGAENIEPQTYFFLLFVSPEYFLDRSM